MCGVSSSSGGDILDDKEPIVGQLPALHAKERTYKNALSVMALLSLALAPDRAYRGAHLVS